MRQVVVTINIPEDATEVPTTLDGVTFTLAGEGVDPSVIPVLLIAAAEDVAARALSTDAASEWPNLGDEITDTVGTLTARLQMIDMLMHLPYPRLG